MTGKPLLTHAEIHAPKKPAADGERFPKRRQPEYVTWFHDQDFPCLAGHSKCGVCCPLVYHSEAAHVTSRGAGGDDIENLVPLCSVHHARLHCIGQKSFEYELGQKLKPVAKRIASAFYTWKKKHG